jgi:hypothetical protein
MRLVFVLKMPQLDSYSLGDVRCGEINLATTISDDVIEVTTIDPLPIKAASPAVAILRPRR